jgi:hypothetical protein
VPEKRGIAVVDIVLSIWMDEKMKNRQWLNAKLGISLRGKGGGGGELRVEP